MMKKDQTAVAWLGHSCFLVEKDGFRIVLDPYADRTVSGYEPLRTDADLVLSSHDHPDHNGSTCVTIRPSDPEKKNPFHIKTISSWHDEAKGRKRGPNTIHILDDGTFRIVHMGDIGCMPDEEQMEELSGADVCLVPTGGFFTMKPEKVHELMDRIHPTIVVPMHYRFRQDGRNYGMLVIAPVSRYLKQCTDAVVYNRNYLLLPDDLHPQTAVLKLAPVRG